MQRTFFWTVAVMVFGLHLSGLFSDPEAQIRNAVGRIMPTDAAPSGQQVFRFMNAEPTNLDIGVAIYEVGGIVFLFERLTMLDYNNRVIPGAAESWEASDDQTRWTFHMRPEGKWSDGRPVTAQDFEYAFKRMFDPSTAASYAFFYYDIKGAQAFNTGQTNDPESVGVKATDDLTLVIETEGPCPYLPMIAAFFTSNPVPRWQVDKYGDHWAKDVNVISNSSYKVGEWRSGQHLMFELDPMYNGPNKGYLTEIKSVFFQNQMASGLLPYENDELDLAQVDVRDLNRIENDPDLSREFHRYMDFNALYLYFRTREGLFSDRRIRRAIGHAIDRDALCNVVLRGNALPAYTMIPPGFPGYAGDQLKNAQRFDVTEARRLLASAGYPGGRGFPATEIWLRGELPHRIMASEAIAAMLKEHLNINVSVRNMEARSYNEKMLQFEVPFSLIPFQYDFPDQHNLLGMVWQTQAKGAGRHDWTSVEFDRLIDEAARETDTDRRRKMYTDAERLLVEDAGGVFVFHDYVLQLRKPWLGGWKKDSIGQEPFFIDNTTITDLYIKRH